MNLGIILRKSYEVSKSGPQYQSMGPCDLEKSFDFVL